MYLVENKEKQLVFFKNLKEIVKKLSVSKDHALDYIKEITMDMQGDIKRNIWKDFEFYFNQMQPGFIEKLLSLYPNLTPAEIRLSVFLRMNMNTQTIADILHISINSTKTARTRLRTKLNLDRETNLSAFISSI